MRRVAAILAALALAGCGDDPATPESSAPRERSEPRAAVPGTGTGTRILTDQVGRGAQTAFVIRPDADGPLPVVLFLHGWGATLPPNYRPWLDHLARRGNAVIYPRYQESVLTPPGQALGNVLIGVRAALKRFEAEPGSLVVAGHSAGGALSADYAAVAGEAALPAPRAIFSMYPGRSLRGVAPSLPEVAPGRIPGGTRIVALAGSRDRVVGTAPAKRIVDAATRVPRADREYVLIEDPAVSDHLGPQRATAPTRRVFWRRLDALIDEVRR